MKTAAFRSLLFFPVVPVTFLGSKAAFRTEGSAQAANDRANELAALRTSAMKSAVQEDWTAVTAKALSVIAIRFIKGAKTLRSVGPGHASGTEFW
jgi:hypothetical protein